jgi:hypothetical protein
VVRIPEERIDTSLFLGYGLPIVGKCTCGNDMVKAKVVKIEKGKADFKAEGWQKERSFKIIGKYACNCSPECKCGTISQNPGKWTCGSEMKKV